MTRSLAFMSPIALLAIATLTACDRPVAPSSRSMTPAVATVSSSDKSLATTLTSDNQTLDVSGTMVSPCSGEAITYTGSIHIVSTTTQTADGVTLKYHLNTQNLSGVGQVTGGKYNINQVVKEGADLVIPSGEESGSVAATYRIVGQGGLDNFASDVVYSFTKPTMQLTYTTQNFRCGG